MGYSLLPLKQYICIRLLKGLVCVNIDHYSNIDTCQLYKGDVSELADANNIFIKNNVLYYK